MKVNEAKNQANESTDSPRPAHEQDREIERYETALRLVEKEISKLREDRDWYKTQIFKLKNPSEPLPLSLTTQTDHDIAEGSVAEIAQLRYMPKLLDLCEIILRRAGNPLHGTVLASELTKAGRPVSGNSITSITQDGMNRFENLGRNVWALREWTEEMKAPFRRKKRNYVRADTEQ